MNIKDIKGLKFFLAYGAVAISAFAYSGISGYKWFGSTKTEEERSTGARTGRVPYFRYHK